MPPETKPSPLKSAVNHTLVAQTANAAHGGAAKAVQDGAEKRAKEVSGATVVGVSGSMAEPFIDKAIRDAAIFFNDSGAGSREVKSMREQKSGTLSGTFHGVEDRLGASRLLAEDLARTVFGSGTAPVTIVANLPENLEVVRSLNAAKDVNVHGAPLETPGSKPAAKDSKTPQH